MVHIIFWIYIITLLVTTLSVFSSLFIAKHLKSDLYNYYIRFLLANALILLCYTIFYFIFKYAGQESEFLNRLYIFSMFALGLYLIYVISIIMLKMTNKEKTRYKLILRILTVGDILVLFIFCFILYSPLFLNLGLAIVGGIFVLGFIVIIVSRKRFKIDRTNNIFVIIFIVSIVLAPLDFAEFFIRKKFLPDDTLLPQGVIIFTVYSLIINYLNLMHSIKLFYTHTFNTGTTTAENDYEDVPGGFTDAFSITNREKEVIEYLVKGYNNKDIAGYLNISQRTVDRHIYNIYKKCDLNNRVDLLNLIRDYQ